MRVWTVWSHPLSDIIGSSLQLQMLGIGLFVVWVVFIKLVFVPIASREVDSFMPLGQRVKNGS